METEVKLERLLDARIEVVWQALIQKDEMKNWFFALADFQADVGFTFQFVGGPTPERQYTHLCEVKEVIPQKKLSYSWRYEGYSGDSLVAFELVAQGSKTLLRFSHAGLDTFPADAPDLAAKNFAEGWNHIILKALPNYIEGKSA
ncbi:MAG: SRPBCC domain-containing protein [Turneriella sp.]